MKEGKLELYDLGNGLKESNNLAAARPELAAQLVAEMRAWRKDNKVPLPPDSVLDF